MISLTCGYDTKNDTNEVIYKTEIDSQTQKTNFMVTKGERWGGWIN